jgi:transglutaminase-like putative cysteine protease
MRMNRRELLIAGTAFAGAAMLPRGASAKQGFIEQRGAWRQFETVTRIDLANPQGRSQAWVPVPSVNEAEWFKSLGSEWKTNAASAKIERDPVYGAEMVHLQWKEGEAAPYAEVTSRISTRDRTVDFSASGNAAPLSDSDRKLYTSATDLIPIDGIVKETSDKITAGASSDVDRARAVYQWIVENTFRDPKTRGCGTGDIAGMLKTGNLKGKCADLNALFVGLVRAAGIPARDVYGIRVAPSKFGYKSLGANSETITKAQHCRAEVYLDGFGWIPADPADVRKVVLEEPPANLAIDDPKVVQARNTLFGAWEGNWLAYNMAHDVALPGSNGAHLGFLMYPQAKNSAGLLDCLDADTFKYVIKSREVAA